MKITITTGGSGGHIFPALTFADGLKDKHDISFIGNDHKMESWIIPEHGYAFYSIHNQGLQGSVLDKVKAVLGQFQAIQDAKKVLKKLQPDVVVSFGGYVTLPVVIAAGKLGIKVVIHEQNALVGKANRLAAKHAQAIVTCYEESFEGDPRVHFLGNPRASLIHETIDSKAVYTDLGLDESLPVVLMVMGSQGSASMNEIFKEYAKGFNHDDYQVIIVPGPTNIDAFNRDVTHVHDNLKIVGFVDQRALLPKLDVILCRSGASTIAEIQSFGLPSILVPSPHVANNHQYYNAKSLADRDACLLVEEKNLDGASMDKIVDALVHDELKKKTLSENVLKMATPNALEDMVALVEGLAYE